MYFLISSISPPHHLMYCENYKIASSTWVTHLFTLNGITYPTGRIHFKAQEMFSPRAQHIKDPNKLKNITTFIIVRDPLERILSAYTVNIIIKVKFCIPFSYTSYKDRLNLICSFLTCICAQDKMQRTYKKKPASEPSFRNVQVTIKNRFRKKERPGVIPTFEEFIMYLVRISLKHDEIQFILFQFSDK